MRQTSLRRVLGAVAALMVSVVLTGCTIPIVNIEVPFEMPDLSSFKLPQIDVDNLNIKPIKLPIGVRTSVDDAREEVLSGNASTLDSSALVEPGYLTVGVKALTSSAPMCMMGEGNSLYGLDVDLAAALASEMGLKVRYVSVVDGSSLGSQCDVVMNSESGGSNDVSVAGTYVESAISFFHKGDPTVVAATDLGGKTVGLQSGSVSETMLNDTSLKMSQKTYANLNEAFNALEAGEVDYVLCEAYPGAYLASLHTGISFAGSIEAPEPSGVGVLSSNSALLSSVQSAFDTIAANGVLQGVRTRWVGTLPTLTTDSQIRDISKD